MTTSDSIKLGVALLFVGALGALAGTSSATFAKRNRPGGGHGWGRKYRQNATTPIDPVAWEREISDADQRIAKLMADPVSRWEFEAEIQRIWEFIDPRLQLPVAQPVTEYLLPSEEQAAKRLCLHCGKPFFAGPGNKKYCSKKCKDDHFERRAEMRKACEHCGDLFTTTIRKAPYTKYCSTECKGKARLQRRYGSR